MFAVLYMQIPILVGFITFDIEVEFSDRLLLVDIDVARQHCDLSAATVFMLMKYCFYFA